MGKDIIIVDNFLQGFSGHFFEYDNSIAKELKKRNINTFIFCNEKANFNNKEAFEFSPYFKKKSIKFGKNDGRLISLINKFIDSFFFFRDLLELKGHINSQKSSTIFVPNVILSNLFPIILFVFIGKFTDKRVILFFRHSLLNAINSPIVYKSACRLLKNRKNVVVVSDSEIIVNECKKYLSISAHLLPIPHTVENKQNVGISFQNKLRVVFPGEARLEKGADIVIGAIDILVKGGKGNDFEFFIQYNSSSNTAFDVGFRKRLNNLKDKCSLRINTVLSSEEYQKQLIESDVILTPYYPDYGYNARTSGIFTEAAAMGKVIITTPRTWMAYQIENLKAEGLIIEKITAEDLAEAIASTKEKFSELNETALLKKLKWCDFHNSENFCNIFLGLV